MHTSRTELIYFDFKYFNLQRSEEDVKICDTCRGLGVQAVELEVDPLRGILSFYIIFLPYELWRSDSWNL